MIKVGDKVIITNHINNNLIGLSGKVIMINDKHVAIKLDHPVKIDNYMKNSKYITAIIDNVIINDVFE